MRTSTRRAARRAAGLLAVAALALGAAACGSDDDATGGSASSDGKPIKLTFAYFSGEKTSFGQLWSWWMDEVEKRTNGRVKFERFWDASLLKAPEMVEGLNDGRVDIAQVSPPYYPGTFPLSTIAELPFITPNLPAVSATFAELHAKNDALRKEWEGKGLVPLAWNAAAGSALGTNKPINRVEDLKGLKIRAVDRGSKILQSAKANLINVEVSEVYSAMSRGLVQGYYGIPFSFFAPLKLNEVTKHLTDLGLGVPAIGALAMSRQGWSRLPEDVQKVMTEVSAEVPTKQGEFEALVEKGSCEAAKEAGVKLNVLPPAEVDRLRSLGEERIRKEWMDEVAGKGAPAEAFYSQYIETVRRFEKEYDYTPGLQACMSSGS
jgi:TRAP-type C4-dicarboxylate transport system substrate-binding protein